MLGALTFAVPVVAFAIDVGVETSSFVSFNAPRRVSSHEQEQQNNYTSQLGQTIVKGLLNEGKTSLMSPVSAFQKKVGTPINFVSFDADSGEDSLTLEFEHFPKCGGTMLRKLLNASVPRNFINKEYSSFRGGAGSFYVGLVRNPYTMLVSQWAFASQGKGAFNSGTPPSIKSRVFSSDIKQQLPAGTTRQDRRKFVEWLKLSSDESVGLFSYRFYGKYIQNAADGPPHVAWGRSEGLRPRPVFRRNATLRKLVLHELREFSQADSLIDCWVRAESLWGDAKVCFERYEHLAGKDSVNWVEFERMKSEVGVANPSDHVECKYFFNDALASFVNRSEYYLLRAFNYSRCV